MIHTAVISNDINYLSILKFSKILIVMQDLRIHLDVIETIIVAMVHSLRQAQLKVLLYPDRL